MGVILSSVLPSSLSNDRCFVPDPSEKVFRDHDYLASKGGRLLKPFVIDTFLASTGRYACTHFACVSQHWEVLQAPSTYLYLRNWRAAGQPIDIAANWCHVISTKMLVLSCHGRTLLSKLAAAEGQWEADKAVAEEAWARAKQQATAEWTAATVELQQQQQQKLDAQRVRFEQVGLPCDVYS